jgi:chromosomal replication initiator protein
MRSGTSLPEFLRVCVERGIVDESTAKRIELYRRTRGLGGEEWQTRFLLDPPDPHLTFDDFIQSEGAAFALELAKTVSSESPSRLPYNPLYIYGPIGLGKTHLLTAIANAAGSKKVLLVNTADLEAEVDNAKHLGVRAALRQWLVSSEILLVDDIQLCEDRQDLQRDLFSVFNHMTRAHRWVVITSDVPPTRLDRVESRLLSRLSGGVIVGLQIGHREDRRNLVRHFFGDRAVPDAVVDLLAERITENVRQIKAAVAQLMVMEDRTGARLTPELAQTLVPCSSAPHPPPPAEEETVLDAARVTDETPEMYKEMLASAASEEEQALALQIALGRRIKELHGTGSPRESLKRLERALALVREGKMKEAIICINS